MRAAADGRDLGASGTVPQKEMLTALPTLAADGTGDNSGCRRCGWLTSSAVCLCRFELLRRIRVARNFSSLTGRRHLVRQRLLAFNALLQCNPTAGEQWQISWLMPRWNRDGSWFPMLMHLGGQGQGSAGATSYNILLEQSLQDGHCRKQPSAHD
jgi:hypothetical protein